MKILSDIDRVIEMLETQHDSVSAGMGYVMATAIRKLQERVAELERKAERIK